MMSPIPGDNRQDPHNPNSDDLSVAAMDTNIMIAAGSSSESAEDDDDDGYQGYEMLPQDPAGPDDEDEEASDEDMDQVSTGAVGGGSVAENSSHRPKTSSSSGPNPSHINVPNIENPEVVERKSLWSQSRLQAHEPMDDDHMSKIKSAMSGFTLPGCQIPTWARVVTEEEWKAQLLGRLTGPATIAPPSDNNDTQQENSEALSQSDPPNKRARCSLDDTNTPLEDDATTTEGGDKVAVDESQQGNDTEER